jgi:hypothetical protein
MGVTQYATPLFEVYRGSSGAEMGCISTANNANRNGMRSFGSGGLYTTANQALDDSVGNTGVAPNSIKTAFSVGGNALQPFGAIANGLWVTTTFNDNNLGIIAQTAGAANSFNLQVKKSMKYRCNYATTATGGVVKVSRQGIGGTAFFNTDTVGLANTNSALGFFESSQVASDAARTALNFYIAGGGVGALNQIVGPACFLWQSCYTPAQKGFSTNTLNYHGGATMTTIADELVAAGPGYITKYFQALRERQIAAGGTGRVIFWMQGGVNGDTGTPESWATNFARVRVAMSAAWTANGYPTNDLAFIGMVTHQVNANPDSIQNLRDTAISVVTGMNTPSNTTIVNIPTLALFSEMTSFWDSLTPPGGPSHLNFLGYNSISERIVRSMGDKRTVTVSVAPGETLPLSTRSVAANGGTAVVALS